MSMKRFTLAAGCAALFVFVSLQAQAPQTVEALDGVDTVLLLKTGKETFGKSAFKTTHGSLTYLFASAETKAEFDAAPDKYAVQMNGTCARMGGGTGGNPSNYAVLDGKIYVFGSDSCRTRFLAAPAKFIPRIAPAMPTSAAAIAAGKTLLAKAAAAHGGAGLDAMTAYAETAKAYLPAERPGPAPEIRNMWTFPGVARSERTFAAGGQPGRTMTVATLLTRRGVWNGMVDAARPLAPLNPAGVPETEMSFGWHLLPLLRERAKYGTSVASVGRATVAGTAVERVRIRRGGVDVTLNIDPASSRVHSLSFVGRNRDGEFGDVSIVFSDYRHVSGVLVPFVEKGSFDGSPDEFWTRTLEKAEVNPPLDPALFAPPASEPSR
jgi:YHS domain-containing protein